ncbi:hypothetical protein J2Z32_000311 [Paenibacillus turicensis]|uniref:Uncharacterized protein n=1 Tax=Paenibacillus turicensis TaxID=160487 RepID=A0ABS4FM93_9BACL|nr:hypothetical protein [Paenibacillus turicensis]MBP1903699.1 hypothetical protein [Paenibacillus turicensis]
MRITEIDLEIEDIEWYGIDSNGRIAQFTSGGSKMVPEFICESRERLDSVCVFFDNLKPNNIHKVSFNEKVTKFLKEDYLEECKIISQKGLYCYDISDEQDNKGEYMLICRPSCELLISDLPENLQSALLNYKIANTNFNINETIMIEKEPITMLELSTSQETW